METPSWRYCLFTFVRLGNRWVYRGLFLDMLSITADLRDWHTLSIAIDNWRANFEVKMRLTISSRTQTMSTGLW
jgi:hypothetical protein